MARRGVIDTYRDLENRRLDAKIEAELGLRFYLESLNRDARTFEYFAGPTNSGKTHAALEALREAESGTYLAPLRLLALEVQERLGELGVITSLVTGEERVLAPGARHVSSTVEMVDLGRRVEVAVVDEAQMLLDEQRGWAWTLAIAGVRAQRIILCGSEDGLGAAERLAARLGMPLLVRRFERKNPLEVVEAISLPEVRAGDAVIAFTRNDVVDLGARIKKFGRSTAAIYGSLSPAVRRREAERFRTGVAEVLVATDAIGLGLNLPIRRIVFATVEKFDGNVRRRLTAAEIRQIAGRAGRYGIHERGLVTALERRALPALHAALEHSHEPLAGIPLWISPTDDHLRRVGALIGTMRVSRLLQFFATRIRNSGEADVRIADLSGQIEVATALELSDRFGDLPFEIRCSYSRAPVSTRGNALNVLGRWAERHAAGETVSAAELGREGPGGDRLLASEERSRLSTLYLWLAQRFPETYVDGDGVLELRQFIDHVIQRQLRAHGERKPNRQQPVAASRPFAARKGPPKFDKRKLPR
jgi:ATP-dependent RNA helicase SUPV3L1/SUV3